MSARPHPSPHRRTPPSPWSPVVPAVALARFTVDPCRCPSSSPCLLRFPLPPPPPCPSSPPPPLLSLPPATEGIEITEHVGVAGLEAAGLLKGARAMARRVYGAEDWYVNWEGASIAALYDRRCEQSLHLGGARMSKLHVV